MTRKQRIGQILFFAIAIVAALAQLISLYGILTAESIRWTSAILPVCILGMLYFVWTGDNTTRILLGAMLLFNSGLQIVVIINVIAPLMVHLDGGGIARVVGGMATTSSGLLLFANAIAGLLLLLSPSVRAFAEYQKELPEDADLAAFIRRASADRKNHAGPDEQDSELCSHTYSRIVDAFGPELDLAPLSEAQRTVVLVWHSYGMIENGGFRYLFEGSFPGDPQFDFTRQAYRAIGCQRAVEAFEEACAVFPNGQPPADVHKRLEIYLKGNRTAITPADSKMFDARSEIEAQLAEYIRSRSEDFAGLDQLRRSPERGTAPLNATQTLRYDIQSLPHWARVAFATRCARRVQQQFAESWPNAPAEYGESIELAIQLAEKSAREGFPSDGLANVIVNTRVAAGAGYAGEYAANDTASAPANLWDGAVSGAVAQVARSAAEAAKSGSGESVNNAFEALRWADGIANDQIRRGWDDDFSRLQQLSKAECPDDGAPVPASFWN